MFLPRRTSASPPVRKAPLRDRSDGAGDHCNRSDPMTNRPVTALILALALFGCGSSSTSGTGGSGGGGSGGSGGATTATGGSGGSGGAGGSGGSATGGSGGSGGSAGSG